MAGLNDWSKTASDNATKGSVNFAEGQAPSTVNDSARALMADLAKQRDDTSGSVETTGAGGVYAMAPNATALNQTTGLMVRVQINHDSPSGGCTFKYGGKGAKAIKIIDSDGERDPNEDELKQNAFCTMTYDADGDSSSGAWIATDIVTAALDTSNFALKDEGEGTKASAATCDIGSVTETRVKVTGTTTITSFGSGANKRKLVRFTNAVTLTHHATSLILPGGADITTAAGDVFEFASDGSGNWRCVGMILASGRALVSDALLDEDDFASNSNTQGATQQSIKAYINDLLRSEILAYQQPSGTAGGSATAGSWTDYPINTKVHDPDNKVTLSSNQFTPSADRLVSWSATFHQTGAVATRLYNVTDSVEVSTGSTILGNTGFTLSRVSVGAGMVEAGKTYKLQYYATAASGGSALGASIATGSVNTYGTVTLGAT